MKQVKVLTVNDGNEQTLHNGNFLYIEEYVQTGEVISKYLNEGWEIVSVCKDYNPSIQGEDGYNFYKGGLTFILQREVENS